VYLALLLWAGVSTLQAAGQQPLQSGSVAGTPAENSSVLIPNGLNSLQGARVAEIRINSEAIERTDWLEPLVIQKINEPLDKYKVRQSVQALYNTGRFALIQVEAQRNARDDVVLTFRATENYFIGSLLVEGAPDPPGNNRLVNAAKLNLGEQFTEEKIAAAIEGMQRILR